MIKAWIQSTILSWKYSLLAWASAHPFLAVMGSAWLLAGSLAAFLIIVYSVLEGRSPESRFRGFSLGPFLFEWTLRLTVFVLGGPLSFILVKEFRDRAKRKRDGSRWSKKRDEKKWAKTGTELGPSICGRIEEILSGDHGEPSGFLFGKDIAVISFPGRDRWRITRHETIRLGEGPDGTMGGRSS